MLTVTAPSSKSVSHRALIAAALAPGASEVSAVLESHDTTGATLPCLAAMGAGMQRDGANVRVAGLPNGPQGLGEAPARLDVKESGTTCRLLTAVAAAGQGRFEVRGEGRMHDRPIAGLAQSLEGQGVRFQWLEKNGFPPFVLETSGLSGGEVAVPMDESSQYLSGLLLAAPLAKAPLRLTLAGRKVVSWPYVALTLAVMEDFGVPAVVETLQNGHWAQADWRAISAVDIDPGSLRFQVTPASYRPRAYAVEGDWSNGSYFLAAGAVAGPLTVTGLRRDSVQGDRAIADILAAMGADLRWQGGALVIAPPPASAGGQLRGIDVDMGHCPDLVMTVAMAALFAQGPTRIRNVAHLRIKESDRLAAVAEAIRAVGSVVEVLDDGLAIDPRPLPVGTAVRFRTHADHRMAMSFSILGLGGVRVELDNPGCVAKSFPGFFEAWAPVAGLGRAAS